MIFKNKFSFLNKESHIAPLAIFRIAFGFMMMVSTLRFFWNGWIEQLYIKPTYFFTYYGFSWVKPLGEIGMYAIFLLLLIASIMILLGYYYKLAMPFFALAFTYVELIDRTNYLNHYYFVSIMSFIMVILPAHRFLSLDTLRKPEIKLEKVPHWMIFIIQLQLAIVYFFAGVAKINYDWLFRAMPLKVWLPANNHLLIIGKLFNYKIVAFIFSWSGMLYDLFIPFALWYRKTRFLAYLAVIFFHVITYAMFQIGMFPFIMILSTTIFFSEKFHVQIATFIQNIFRKKKTETEKEMVSIPIKTKPILKYLLITHFVIQFLFPFRYLLYPGKLFWTEQGYRFSWRVMLMEKNGYATFYVKNLKNDKEFEFDYHGILSPNQIKMMSTQPDMLLQFAHYIHDFYKKKNIPTEVRAKVYVAVNGRDSKLLLDPETNLVKEEDSFLEKKWIINYSLSSQKRQKNIN